MNSELTVNDIENIITEFKGHFSDNNKPLMESIIRNGLVPIKSARNYNMVIQIKDLLFNKNFSYSKSVRKVAKKYGITERRVRKIYSTNMKYKLIDR